MVTPEVSWDPFGVAECALWMSSKIDSPPEDWQVDSDSCDHFCSGVVATWNSC